MNLKEFLKYELSGWNRAEIISFLIVFAIIFFTAVSYRDNPVAVVSAICGIFYTIIAGKGKISCYFFGIASSICYSLLSFQNALWGNLILNLCYYLPMEILGIFKWKKHLKKETREIIKTKLKKNELVKLLIFCFIGCITTITVLWLFKDKNPVFDGITTVLSIAGMYLTVKRYIEQWIIWMIVNGLSVLMWLGIVIYGTKAYATVIMWGVYFIIAIYFYFIWKKELETDSSLI